MRRLLLLAALLLCFISPAYAQNVGRPYGAAALGVSHVPGKLTDPCGMGNPFRTAELRGGLSRGRTAIELGAAIQVPQARNLCAVDPIVYENGVHTETYSPYGPGELLGTDLRVRHRIAGPLVLSGGAGWLWSHDLPYALTSAGLRTGGRMRLVLDVERQWMRIAEVHITQEWKDLKPVRLISQSRTHDWQAGYGIRLGMELTP